MCGGESDGDGGVDRIGATCGDDDMNKGGGGGDRDVAGGVGGGRGEGDVSTTAFACAK